VSPIKSPDTSPRESGFLEAVDGGKLMKTNRKKRRTQKKDDGKTKKNRKRKNQRKPYTKGRK
jgi:hypothetical protein